MSNDVNNLAHSFVAMAQAFEQLPKVQETLKHTEAANVELLDRIQKLELRLIDRANELEAAHAATRKAEVERDHAETMFLETDDKLLSLKRLMQGQIDAAQSLFAAMEPSKPEPEPEAVKVEASEGERVADPTTAPTPSFGDTPKEIQSASPVASTSTESASPNVAPSWATATFEPETALGASAVSGESVASSTTPLDAPEVASPSDPTLATESSSESGSPVSTESEARPEPSPKYSEEWYRWADAVGFWNKPAVAYPV